MHCFVYACLCFCNGTQASGVKSLVVCLDLAILPLLSGWLFDITLILLSCGQTEWCPVFILGATLWWCANEVSDMVSAQLGTDTISEPRGKFSAALENCVH